MDVRRGSQDEIDGGQAVVPRSSQLTLGIDGAAFDLVVDVQSRQGEQLVEKVVVVDCSPRRVAGLEQEGQARCDPPDLHPLRDLISAFH